MRIALIGTGRMGTTVARLADERGHDLVAFFNSTRTLDDAEAIAILAEAEVIIDFSVPDAVPANVDTATNAATPIVVGTTGWYHELPALQALVENRGGTLLYAPNFSLGIALLSQAVRAVTPLLNRLEEFDLYVSETHHVRKIDSPSGTALHLATILMDGVHRKRRIETETPGGTNMIDRDALYVSSMRAGAVVGEHDVHIDGPDDHLTLSHQAKSRDGFARGALVAAEWLAGRTGVFTLDDVIRYWNSFEEPTTEKTTETN